MIRKRSCFELFLLRKCQIIDKLPWSIQRLVANRMIGPIRPKMYQKKRFLMGLKFWKSNFPNFLLKLNTRPSKVGVWNKEIYSCGSEQSITKVNSFFQSVLGARSTKVDPPSFSLYLWSNQGRQSAFRSRR